MEQKYFNYFINCYQKTVDEFLFICYNIKVIFGGVAQLVRALP